MAKASAQDIEAAGDLMVLLNALSDGRHPDPSKEDEGAWHFDPDDRQHLRDLYDALDQILERSPGMPGRIIGAMCYVIMWDQNKIIDPDADTLEMHPIHIENAKGAALAESYRELLKGACAVLLNCADVIDADGDSCEAHEAKSMAATIHAALDASQEKA